MKNIIVVVLIGSAVLFLIGTNIDKVLNTTMIWKDSKENLNVLPKVTKGKRVNLEEELINQGFLKVTIIDDQLINSEWEKHTLENPPITFEIPKRFYLDENEVFKNSITLYSSTKEEPTKDMVNISLLLKNYPEFDATKYSADKYYYVPTMLKMFLDAKHTSSLENVPKLVLDNGKTLYIFKETDNLHWHFFYVPTNEQYGYMVSINEVSTIGEENSKKFVKKLCESLVLGELTDEQINQYWPLREIVSANQ